MREAGADGRTDWFLPTGTMHRPERIAETLREEIAQIVGYELEDPRLTLVTVTEVRVADDLRDASVYVTVQGDEREHQTALRALQHAAPYVRKQQSEEHTSELQSHLNLVC